MNREQLSRSESSLLASTNADFEKASSRFVFDAVASDCKSIARCMIPTEYIKQIGHKNLTIQMRAIHLASEECGLPCSHER